MNNERMVVSVDDNLFTMDKFDVNLINEHAPSFMFVGDNDNHVVCCDIIKQFGNMFGAVMSKNEYYGRNIPGALIYDSCNKENVDMFLEKKKMSVTRNFLLLDDIHMDMEDIKNIKLFAEFCYNARHYKFMWMVVDRDEYHSGGGYNNNMDVILLFGAVDEKKMLFVYNNYGKCVSSFLVFKLLMERMARDGLVMVIMNNKLYWYKIE